MLASGPSMGYDKLVLSPGIDMMWDTVEGSEAANTTGQILQVGKAGPETTAMRKQLEAIPDGGVYTIDPQPVLTNTCYSFLSDELEVHVASVHQYVAAEKTYKTVPGSGGVSTAPNELEGVYGMNWARNIRADTLM